MPFSLCRITWTPGGRWFGTSVGSPMPRFTYSPSFSSAAARAAISSRVQDISGLRSRAGRALLDALLLGLLRSERYDALDEDAGQMDRIRIERSDLDDLLGLDDRQATGHRGDRVEVARGGVEHAVPGAIGDRGTDQRDVG